MAKIAVIESGGKQYVVTNDSIVQLEKVKAGKDGKVTFDRVILIDDGKDIQMGAPYIKDASVSGEIVSEGRSAKISVIRYRQKSRYFKKNGHRQPYSKVRITALP